MPNRQPCPNYSRDGEKKNLFQKGHLAGTATVLTDPQYPSVLGLQNLSTNPWIAVLPGSEVREVPMGKSVKLASGSRIDFGTSQGEVQ